MKAAAVIFRRLAIAVATAMLLAGCVTTGPGPDSKPTDTTTGLVVVGFVYTGTLRIGITRGCILGRSGPFVGSNNLDFFKLDENNQTAWHRRRMAYDGACEPANAPTAARYSFLELSPGRYRLDGITNASLQPRVIFNNGPTFTIAPGEVLYIGDVVCENGFDQSLAKSWFHIVNTEESARAALAARNEPADRMVVRPLEIVIRPNYQ